MNLRQFYQQQQRDAAKMHLCAGIDCEASNKFWRHLAYELGNTIYPLILLLVECIAERCSYYGRLEFQLRSHGISPGTLIVLFSLHFLQHRIVIHLRYIFNCYTSVFKRNGATSVESLVTQVTNLVLDLAMKYLSTTATVFSKQKLQAGYGRGLANNDP
jgi:hypothetical protein